MEKVKEAKLRLALLKENFEYRDFFSGFLEWYKNRSKGEPLPVLGFDNFELMRLRRWPVLGFNKFGLTGLRRFISHPLYHYDKIIELINPQIEIYTSPDALIERILPRLFDDHAVEIIMVQDAEHLLDVADGLQVSGLAVAAHGRPISHIERKGLNPWERLYKVDLTKKKSQILKEFKAYLEAACASSKNSDWAPYKKRQREETWKHLGVWKLRRKRKTFTEISNELGVTLDAAKKSFYRAYELTQWKRYDPEALKKEVWYVKKDDIRMTCDACQQRESCTELCPDVLKYVNQDSVMLREKIFADDSDSHRDYLLKKRS